MVGAQRRPRVVIHAWASLRSDYPTIRCFILSQMAFVARVVRFRFSALRFRTCHGFVVGQGEQVAAQLVERFGADARHAAQVVVIDVRPVGFARGDNPLGERLANVGQLADFRPARISVVPQDVGKKVR